MSPAKRMYSQYRILHITQWTCFDFTIVYKNLPLQWAYNINRIQQNGINDNNRFNCNYLCIYIYIYKYQNKLG